MPQAPAAKAPRAASATAPAGVAAQEAALRLRQTRVMRLQLDDPAHVRVIDQLARERGLPGVGAASGAPASVAGPARPEQLPERPPAPRQLVPTQQTKQPLAVPPVLVDDLGDATPRTRVALNLLLRAVDEPAALARLLAGASGEVCRAAARYLMGELLLARAPTSFPFRLAGLGDEQQRVALTWLDNLVGAGIAGDEPTHALPYGQAIVATLAGAATLLLDREALLVLLAGPKPASTHLVSRAGPAPYGHLYGDHPPGKRRAILTDGAALGSAGKVLRAPLPQVEAVWEMWCDYALHHPGGSKPATRLLALSLLAREALQVGSAWPFEQLTTRTLALPATVGGASAVELYLAALERGTDNEAAKLVGYVAESHYRRFINVPDQLYTHPAGATVLHRLAADATLDEKRAVGAVARLAERGINFAVLAVHDEHANNLADATWPVPASVAAVRRGRWALAQCLVQYEARQRATAPATTAEARLEQAATYVAEAREALGSTLDKLCLGRVDLALDALDRLYLEDGWAPKGAGAEAQDLGELIAGAVRTAHQIRRAVWQREGWSPNETSSPEEEKSAADQAALRRTLESLNIVQRTDSQDFGESRQLLVAALTQVALAVDENLAAEKSLSALAKATKRPIHTVVVSGVLRGLEAQRGRGPLTFLASMGTAQGLALLLAADDAEDTYDYAGAYVHALATERSLGPRGERPVADALLVAARSPRRLWALLYAAATLRSTAGVTRVVAHAREHQLTLDDVAGPAAPMLLSLAAQTSVHATKALWSCVATPAVRAQWLRWTDASGDGVLHLAARASSKLLPALAKEAGFVPELLTQAVNASGLTPLDEAVRAGAAEPLQMLWERRRGWGIDEVLQDSLMAAAAEGNTVGLGALLARHAYDASLPDLLERALAQLEAHGHGRRAAALRAAVDAVPTATAGETTVAVAAGVPDVQGAPEATVVRSSVLEELHERVRLAGSPARTERALLALEAYLASATGQREEPALRQRCAWAAIDALEQHAFGRYFGKHFAAHRPQRTDDQLLRRLALHGRYGASRFGEGAGVAVLRLRRRVLQAAAAEQNRRTPGRYALHLTDAEADGAGFVLGAVPWAAQSADDAPPQPFAASTWVRAVVWLGHGSEPPQLVSMYPVPELAGERRAEERLVGLAGF